EDGRDHVAAAAIAEHAEHRHGRDRLNNNHAVEDEIPESERASQARRAGGGGSRIGGHGLLVSVASRLQGSIPPSYGGWSDGRPRPSARDRREAPLSVHSTRLLPRQVLHSPDHWCGSSPSVRVFHLA